MKSVTFGSDNTALSTSASGYNFLTASYSTSWNATESARTIPISEQITLTKVTVILDTAPGVGKQYAFAIRDDGADAMSFAITDANTTNSWTGSAVIAINSLVAIAHTPTGTPTAPTNVWWVVEYSTAGQSFLMMGSNNNNGSQTNTEYSNIGAGIGTAWSTTDGDFDILVPSGGTLTALSVACPAGSPGTGNSYAISVHRNNTTDDLTATISDAATAAQATGSVAWSAGDSLAIKHVPTSTPTARRLAWCISVTPTTNGETFFGFGGAQVPSASATNYEQMNGNGNNGWNSSESVRLSRPPGVDYKKLYIKTTDPSPGNRTITFFSNGGASTLTANIAAGTTTANDTTHTVTHTAGQTGTWRSTVASSPAASTGFHIGCVMFIAQTSAALTGTITSSTTEADIVAGGKTIILTLTGDTWIAAGALSFDLQRQAIIDGIDSAQSEATGWDLVPKALQSVSGVVRTSDTVVTITLDAFVTYNITATETVTATIPATALTGALAVVASPTFTISTSGGITYPGYMGPYGYF